MKIELKQSEYIRKFFLKELQISLHTCYRELEFRRELIENIEKCLLIEHCEKSIEKIKFYKAEIKFWNAVEEFVRINIHNFEKEEIYYFETLSTLGNNCLQILLNDIILKCKERSDYLSKCWEYQVIENEKLFNEFVQENKDIRIICEDIIYKLVNELETLNN